MSSEAVVDTPDLFGFLFPMTVRRLEAVHGMILIERALNSDCLWNDERIFLPQVIEEPL